MEYQIGREEITRADRICSTWIGRDEVEYQIWEGIDYEGG